MNPKLAIQQLESIVLNMKEQSVKERVLVHGSVMSILMGLEREAERNGVDMALFAQYRGEVVHGVEVMCGLELELNGGYSAAESRALGGCSKLKSKFCFGV